MSSATLPFLFVNPRSFPSIKEIDLSVHDRLDVAGFDPGPMILDHLIGLKDIGTDLVSPGNIPFFPVLTIQFGALSILLDLINFGLQHVQRHLTISALAPFGLAGHNDSGRKMSNSDRGLDFVNVLAAFAAAPESINGKIFFVNFDCHIFLQFRHRIDTGKGGMAAFVRSQREKFSPSDARPVQSEHTHTRTHR